MVSYPETVSVCDEAFESIPIMYGQIQFLCEIDWNGIRDLEDAFSQDEAIRAALAQQIRIASMNVGFFYGTLVFLQGRAGSHCITILVKNHGISQDCLDEVLKVNKEYYSLSVDEKMKVRLSPIAASNRRFIHLLAPS